MPENTEHTQNSKSNSATISFPTEWSVNFNPDDSTTILNVQPPNKNRWTVKEIELTFPAQIFFSGKLSKHREVKNLPILVDYEDGEYIVSEQQFFNHAARSNFNDAILAFVQNLSDAYDSLLEEESNLGGHLQEELEYFRSIIISE